MIQKGRNTVFFWQTKMLSGKDCWRET